MKNVFLYLSKFIVVPLMTIYVVAFGFTSYLRYPEPIRLFRMLLAQSQDNTAALSELFPSHPVMAGGSAPHNILQYSEDTESIEKVNWKGNTVPFETFLEESRTRAFILIRQGQITHEWYHPNYGAQYLFPIQSISKVITSLVVGNLVEQGVIDEETRLVSYVPEWSTGDEFDDITIRHLLDMQSGVDVPEIYPEKPLEYIEPLMQMYGTTDHEHFISRHRDMAFTPGAYTEYRSVDTQLLGMAVVRITGRHLSDLVSEWFWMPIGAEHNAAWSVDRIGGTEKAFSGFACTARDLARIGVLLANEGMIGDQRLVPDNWVARLSTPVGTESYGWGYSAQMWHPTDGIQLGLGALGQHMYIDSKTDTVLIKLAESYEYEDDEVWEFDVLHEIARRANYLVND